MAKSVRKVLLYIILVIVAAAFLFPVFIVLMNSFKNKLYISSEPFSFPMGESFAGIENYTSGLEKTGFFSAFGWSLFITLGSVLVIVLFSAMTAWYITRVKSRITSAMYYAFVFSMIVPFQMVMFSMSKLANTLRLDNPLGIIVIYLGFGAGLSVFMFCGFIKSIPLEIEEAAMWIWNDYLLPYLVIGSEYKTIPIAIQYLKGGYGSVDMGAMMAMLVLAIIPIVVFYLTSQKYIIKGVVAGAVKG